MQKLEKLPILSFPILIDSRSLLQVFQHALFIFLTFTSTASGSLGLDGLGTYKVFVLGSLHQNHHPKLAKLKNKKNSLKNKKKNKKVTKTRQNLVGGFSPPWTIWYRHIGSWNPKDTGWKVQKSLSCLPLERSRELSKKSNWAPLHLHLSCSLPRSWALRSNFQHADDVWVKAASGWFHPKSPPQRNSYVRFFSAETAERYIQFKREKIHWSQFANKHKWKRMHHRKLTWQWISWRCVPYQKWRWFSSQQGYNKRRPTTVRLGPERSARSSPRHSFFAFWTTSWHVETSKV